MQNQQLLKNIVGLKELIFNFDLKNKSKETVDRYLKHPYDQISTSQYILQPFYEIKQNILVKSFGSEDNCPDEEEKIYLTYLHQVINRSNESSSFCFISSVILPDFNEIELFLRENLEDYKSEVKQCYFSVSYIGPLELSYLKLLEIFNFNTQFLKDLLQDGHNVQELIFDNYLQSKSTIKFLQVLINEQNKKINLKTLFVTQKSNHYNPEKIDFNELKYLSSKFKDIVDFSLIEKFNFQRKKEQFDNNLSLISIFNDFKTKLFNQPQVLSQQSLNYSIKISKQINEVFTSNESCINKLEQEDINININYQEKQNGCNNEQKKQLIAIMKILNEKSDDDSEYLDFGKNIRKKQKSNESSIINKTSQGLVQFQINSESYQIIDDHTEDNMRKKIQEEVKDEICKEDLKNNDKYECISANKINDINQQQVQNQYNLKFDNNDVRKKDINQTNNDEGQLNLFEQELENKKNSIKSDELNQSQTTIDDSQNQKTNQMDEEIQKETNNDDNEEKNLIFENSCSQKYLQLEQENVNKSEQIDTITSNQIRNQFDEQQVNDDQMEKSYKQELIQSISDNHIKDNNLDNQLNIEPSYSEKMMEQEIQNENLEKQNDITENLMLEQENVNKSEQIDTITNNQIRNQFDEQQVNDDQMEKSYKQELIQSISDNHIKDNNLDNQLYIEPSYSEKMMEQEIQNENLEKQNDITENFMNENQLQQEQDCLELKNTQNDDSDQLNNQIKNNNCLQEQNQLNKEVSSYQVAQQINQEQNVELNNNQDQYDLNYEDDEFFNSQSDQNQHTDIEKNKNTQLEDYEDNSLNNSQCLKEQIPQEDFENQADLNNQNILEYKDSNSLMMEEEIEKELELEQNNNFSHIQEENSNTQDKIFDENEDADQQVNTNIENEQVQQNDASDLKETNQNNIENNTEIQNNFSQLEFLQGETLQDQDNIQKPDEISEEVSDIKSLEQEVKQMQNENNDQDTGDNIEDIIQNSIEQIDSQKTNNNININQINNNEDQNMFGDLNQDDEKEQDDYFTEKIRVDQINLNNNNQISLHEPEKEMKNEYLNDNDENYINDKLSFLNQEDESFEQQNKNQSEPQQNGQRIEHSKLKKKIQLIEINEQIYNNLIETKTNTQIDDNCQQNLNQDHQYDLETKQICSYDEKINQIEDNSSTQESKQSQEDNMMSNDNQINIEQHDKNQQSQIDIISFFCQQNQDNLTQNEKMEQEEDIDNQKYDNDINDKLTDTIQNVTFSEEQENQNNMDNNNQNQNENMQLELDEDVQNEDKIENEMDEEVKKQVSEILNEIIDIAVEEGKQRYKLKLKQERKQSILQRKTKQYDGDDYYEPELLENIQTILNNEEFQYIYKTNMYRHVFLKQDFYQIIEIFDPSTTTVNQFIKSFSDYTNVTTEDVRKRLNFKKDVQLQLDSDTLFDCIYNKQQIYFNDNSFMFLSIRKYFEESQKRVKRELDPNPQENLVKQSSKKIEYPIFNRKNPLVLCKKAHHFKNFDFLNEKNIKNKTVTQSIVQRDFIDQKFNFLLFPIEYIYQYVLPTPTINILLQSTAVFTLLKDLTVTQSFQENYNLVDKVNNELLMESLSFITYSKTRNLEQLEVIGDVVIKYISSLYLVHHLPNETENNLTIIRRIAAFCNYLHLYAQTKKPTSYDWKYNLFKFNETSSDNNKNIQTLTYSNLSDMLESIIGSIYASNNFTLQVCLEFINSLGLNFDKNIQNQCFNQVKGSFQICNDILNELQVEENMTYNELYQLSIYDKNTQTIIEEEKNETEYHCQDLYELYKQVPTNINLDEQCPEKKIFIWNLINQIIKQEQLFYQRSEVEYVNNTDPDQRRRDTKEYRNYKKIHEQLLENTLQIFERNINYKFKDKSLLINALNCRSNPDFTNYLKDYQNLEFLGDSIIEILVVSNGYDITRNKLKKINTPYFFCEMKSLLLSNDFMSRLAVLHKFHCFALNIPTHLQNEISNFIKDCHINSKFKEPISHITNSPKILGDLWESVAGAIIMDSDIPTFVKVYGKLYAPYICHFSIFYDKIIFNVKEKVQLVAQQTYQSLEKETEVFDDKGRYKYKVNILVKQIIIGFGVDDAENLAEKKAFQDAYDNIFIKKCTNLGLIFQGQAI